MLDMAVHRVDKGSIVCIALDFSQRIDGTNQRAVGLVRLLAPLFDNPDRAPRFLLGALGHSSVVGIHRLLQVSGPLLDVDGLQFFRPEGRDVLHDIMQRTTFLVLRLGSRVSIFV